MNYQIEYSLLNGANHTFNTRATSARGALDKFKAGINTESKLISISGDPSVTYRHVEDFDRLTTDERRQALLKLVLGGLLYLESERSYNCVFRDHYFNGIKRDTQAEIDQTISERLDDLDYSDRSNETEYMVLKVLQSLQSDLKISKYWRHGWNGERKHGDRIFAGGFTPKTHSDPSLFWECDTLHALLFAHELDKQDLERLLVF